MDCDCLNTKLYVSEAKIIRAHRKLHRIWMEKNGFKVSLEEATKDFSTTYGWVMKQAICYECHCTCDHQLEEELYSQTNKKWPMTTNRRIKFFPYPEIGQIDEELLEEIMEVHLEEDQILQGIRDPEKAIEHFRKSFAFIIYQAQQQYLSDMNGRKYDAMKSLKQSLRQVNFTSLLNWKVH